MQTLTLEEIKKSQDEIKNLGKEIFDPRSSLELTENIWYSEKQCWNMDAHLQEFYNNQIDPEYTVGDSEGD